MNMKVGLVSRVREQCFVFWGVHDYGGLQINSDTKAWWDVLWLRLTNEDRDHEASTDRPQLSSVDGGQTGSLQKLWGVLFFFQPEW